MDKYKPVGKLSIVKTKEGACLHESLETDDRILCIEDALSKAQGSARQVVQLKEGDQFVVLDVQRDKPPRSVGICRPSDRNRYLVIDLDSFEAFNVNKVVIT